MRKYWIAGGALLVIVLAWVGYRGFRKNQAAQKINYQTVEVNKGTLTAYMGSTGTVRSNQTAELSWKTSGQIEEIYVESGDAVKEGQLLAKLAQLSLPRNIINARADIVEARRALQDLQKSDLQRQKAYQTYINAQQELDDALDERESKDYQRASDAVLDEARANYLMSVDAVKDAEETFSNVEHLYEEDPERIDAMADLADARKQRDAQQSNLNYLLSIPDELEISEADARIDVARAALEDAEREWERLKEGVDPDDMAAAEARLASSESTLDMAEIRAPFSGIITDIRSKAGDMINASTVSFRLDDLSQKLIDVDISEVDINTVKIGQKAEITFDALLDQEYNGKVVETAPVGVTSQQNVVNFPVTIGLVEDDAAVMPGMTAAVNIITVQVENVLMVPNRALREIDGKRVLFLLNEGQQEKVVVETGASSDTYMEVRSESVHEGDLVILNPALDVLAR